MTRAAATHATAPRKTVTRTGAIVAKILSGPIHLYRYLVSPLLPMSCRYLPSCSDYALQALKTHGPTRGLGLAVRRLARCHPWGGHGLDPVPPHTHEHAGRR